MQSEENTILKDSSDNKPSETFDKYPLKPALLSGLQESGYIKPFPLQQRALKPLLQGKDVFVESSCASGKTIAMMIAALQLINTEANDCQALILTPTREICRQTMEYIEKIGKNMKIKAISIIGGVPFEAQKQKLKEGVSLVLGTPGRISDLIHNGDFKLEKLKLVVLDESNHLLDIGFEAELKNILKFVPMDVQFCMLSSWYSPIVQRMAEFCLKEPVCVSTCSRTVDMKSVDHFKVNVKNQEEKIVFLKELYENLGYRKSVIYCKKREDREKIFQVLREKGVDARNLDSHTSEVEMGYMMGGFGAGYSQQVIVTEDPEIFIEYNCTPSNAWLIINYDLPKTEKDYQENFGIPSRFSTRKQRVISLVFEDDLEMLKEIESTYSIEFKDYHPTDVLC